MSESMTVDVALTLANVLANINAIDPSDKAVLSLAAEVRRLRDHVPDAGKMVEPSGREVLRNVFALCEHTEDLDTNTPNDFLRGRKFEAKSLRNAIGTWFADECSSQKTAPAVDHSEDMLVMVDLNETVTGQNAILASLGAALKRLTFAARTSGGVAGPDIELISACEQAEAALSLGGMGKVFMTAAEPTNKDSLTVEPANPAQGLDHSEDMLVMVKPADKDFLERPKQCLHKANGQAEHFERGWYLRGDEIEKLTEKLEASDAWARALRIKLLLRDSEINELKNKLERELK